MEREKEVKLKNKKKNSDKENYQKNSKERGQSYFRRKSLLQRVKKISVNRNSLQERK